MFLVEQSEGERAVQLLIKAMVDEAQNLAMAVDMML